jgi:hypothetical protein
MEKVFKNIFNMLYERKKTAKEINTSGEGKAKESFSFSLSK